MRLGHVELFCKNCEVTRDFYVANLGFEETEVQGGQYIWLRSDGFEILLRPGKGDQSAASYRKVASALVVYCRDLAEFSERLRLCGAKFGAPDGTPDSITFQDPDGRWLQAVEGD